ncbi:MAG: hypothetical protein JXJ04_22935 [Spirochaetales bacterium]|nr:hypothetical protein [Spirochaetales bacterium]
MKIDFFIPRIPFTVRMMCFALCETAGILIQVFLPSFFILSLVVMIGGATLIMARNYRNKPMDLGFEDWKPATTKEFQRIEQNLTMTKKISYPFIYKGGFGVFIFVILGIVAFFSFMSEKLNILILVLDFCIIFFPVSWTGKVDLWTPIQLKMKMERFKTVLNVAETSAPELIVTPYLRLDKDKTGRQIPEDVRLMIEPKRKPPDFIGVQIQVAINNGPNGAVPYMYAVFLCKGKKKTYELLKQEDFGVMVKEPGGDDEYGFIVIRQKTGGGGYHTDSEDCKTLFMVVKEKLVQFF